jgi:hypothetical protein
VFVNCTSNRACILHLASGLWQTAEIRCIAQEHTSKLRRHEGYSGSRKHRRALLHTELPDAIETVFKARNPLSYVVFLYSIKCKAPIIRCLQLADSQERITRQSYGHTTSSTERDWTWALCSYCSWSTKASRMAARTRSSGI